jgi:hypothetical protein
LCFDGNLKAFVFNFKSLNACNNGSNTLSPKNLKSCS